MTFPPHPCKVTPMDTFITYTTPNRLNPRKNALLVLAVIDAPTMADARKAAAREFGLPLFDIAAQYYNDPRCANLPGLASEAQISFYRGSLKGAR